MPRVYHVRLDGEFWTGTRFSPHIGEAMRYTLTDAHWTRHTIEDRTGQKPDIEEARENE